jgi:myosin-1
VEGVDDAKEFEATLEAMKAVTMKGKEIEATFKLVSLVLHLGSVHFVAKDFKGAEGSAVKGGTEQGLKTVLTLASSSSDSSSSDFGAALSHALTHRQLHTMAPGGKVETYEVPLNPTQAAASKDALAKTIYARLFDRLVGRVNRALDKASAEGAMASGVKKKTVDDDDDDEGGGDGMSEESSIGVLDIYGFEIFEKNGFEQLCINYVNEKLQQIFIELTLKAEQEEYQEEGIAWKPIPFFNNKVVCDLIEARGKGKSPPGVLPILDDVCRTMHAKGGAEGLDAKFVETVAQFHSRGSAHFIPGGAQRFTIKHYAGEVSYSASGFGDANRDALRSDLLLLCKHQEWSDPALQSLFPEEVSEVEDKKASTAGATIRSQCAKLVTALMDCTPHYVRCLKSNDAKKACSMDSKRAAHQVQYLGLPENIRVRRAGFAYRGEYHRFLERFRILSKETWDSARNRKKNKNGSSKSSGNSSPKSDRLGCKSICQAASKKISTLTKQECQFGTTKLFIKQPETFFALEKLRSERVGAVVAGIQRAWRRFMSRIKFVKLAAKTNRLFAQNGKARR